MQSYAPRLAAHRMTGSEIWVCIELIMCSSMRQQKGPVYRYRNKLKVLKASLVHLVPLTLNMLYSPTTDRSPANSLWLFCLFEPKSPQKMTISETFAPSLPKTHHRLSILPVNRRTCFANLNLDKVASYYHTHTQKKQKSTQNRLHFRNQYITYNI